MTFPESVSLVVTIVMQLGSMSVPCPVPKQLIRNVIASMQSITWDRSQFERAPLLSSIQRRRSSSRKKRKMKIEGMILEKIEARIEG
jgi:hypothetical protein